MKGCRSDGELRAYLDAELPAREQAALASHLQECARCRELVDRLESDRMWVNERLATLPGEKPLETAQAWGRLNEAIENLSLIHI